MDGLKAINDEQGHAQGDHALKTLAWAMRQSLRENDIPARLSGDEFVMLVVVESESELDDIATRIEKALAEENLSASMGKLLISNARHTLEYWLKKADEKMYQQKRKKHSQ